MESLGKLSKHPDGYEIKLERIYTHPREKVWDALTDPAKMSMWFTDVKWEFKPGGKITFIFQDEDHTESFGRFVAIDPPRLLEFFWESDGSTPDELARWELFEEGEKQTRLVLTYSRVTEDLAVNVATGWHTVMDDLGDFLNGKTDFYAFGGEGQQVDKGLKGEYAKQFNQIK